MAIDGAEELLIHPRHTRKHKAGSQDVFCKSRYARIERSKKESRFLPEVKDSSTRPAFHIFNSVCIWY